MMSTTAAEDPLFLDKNENHFGCSQFVNIVLKKILENENNNLNRYPDNENELIGALKNHYNNPSAYFSLFNGSISALNVIFSELILQDSTVLSLYPSYWAYKALSKKNNIICESLSLNNNFSINFDQLLTYSNYNKLSAVFLASPNNPTGNVFSINDIKSLCHYLKKSIIIIDEAYAEYAGISYHSLLDKYNNLIIVKTFSKAYGLAGLRIGYLMTNKQLFDKIQNSIIPYSVSRLSIIAAIEALKDQEHLKLVINNTNANRYELYQFLNKKTFLKPYLSKTNFIFVKINSAISKNLQKFLINHNVFIRFYEDSNFIRITVGTQDEMIKLMKIFDKFEKEVLHECI